MESFFYGTALTPVVEFAFNPDFLKRIHGHPSLRRPSGANYNSFGAGYDAIGAGGVISNGGIIASRPSSARSATSVVRRVVLQPGKKKSLIYLKRE